MSELDVAEATVPAFASTVSVAIVYSATAVAVGPSADVVDYEIATTAVVFVFLSLSNEVYDGDEVLYRDGNKILFCLFLVFKTIITPVVISTTHTVMATCDTPLPSTTLKLL